MNNDVKNTVKKFLDKQEESLREGVKDIANISADLATKKINTIIAKYKVLLQSKIDRIKNKEDENEK